MSKLINLIKITFLICVLFSPFFYVYFVLMDNTLLGTWEVGNQEVEVRTVVVPRVDNFITLYNLYRNKGENISMGQEILINDPSNNKTSTGYVIIFSDPKDIPKNSKKIQIDKRLIMPIQIPLSLFDRKICLRLNKEKNLGSSGSYTVYLNNEHSQKLEKNGDCLSLDEKLIDTLNSNEATLFVEPSLHEELDDYERIVDIPGLQLITNVKVSLTTELVNKWYIGWIYFITCALIWSPIASFIEIKNHIKSLNKIRR